MLLYPAIDLKDGKCVRLFKGDMNKATVFSDDPAAQAVSFQKQGASFIHVVDLNGAFEGESINTDAVRSIISAVDIPIQLGGGIRTIDNIRNWLKAGVNRVILGTVALKNPQLVKDACKEFPDRIVVGIDAREGMVSVEGWAEKSTISVLDLAREFENAGVAAIIYTDVGKDGAMEGADINGTKELAENISTPVIASGGVSSLDDLRTLKKLEKYGVCGVISGRAIYDGKIDIKEAMKVL